MSENDDLINTLLNELVLVLLEAGNVAGTACGGEGTTVARDSLIIDVHKTLIGRGGPRGWGRRRG